jgi:hypothetical protein
VGLLLRQEDTNRNPGRRFPSPRGEDTAARPLAADAKVGEGRNVGNVAQCPARQGHAPRHARLRFAFGAASLAILSPWERGRASCFDRRRHKPKSRTPLPLSHGERIPQHGRPAADAKVGEGRNAGKLAPRTARQGHAPHQARLRFAFGAASLAILSPWERGRASCFDRKTQTEIQDAASPLPWGEDTAARPPCGRCEGW